MKNKKSWKLSVLPLTVLILAGIVTWGIFTGLDRAELEDTLADTISFTKMRLQNYEDYTANDRVKSLVRLLDKTVELSRDMKERDSYGQQELDDYVVQQRLTGAVILNEDLDMVLQSVQDENTRLLWKEVVDKDYIKEILEHPEETYTERMQIKNEEYDVAVVPRQDAEGLLFAYAEKDEKTYGDMTLGAVLADFPVSMNGVIVVCSGDTVVSTNQSALLGMTGNELQEYYGSSLDDREDGLICINPKNSTWYGGKDKMGEYIIYVFFPASQIFMTRSVVCGLYVAIAVFIYLLLQLVRSNIEKTALRQSQKRMRIINALGTAYSSIILFDLTAGRAEAIKKFDDKDIVLEGDLLSKENQKKYVSELVSPEYREEFLQFVDIDTVVQRLKGQQSLTYTSRMENGMWLLSVIVPQRYDREGNITAILLANRDVTKEKEREMEQEKELRSALAVAEHANKAKTNFLNSISHDIRTPMNAVIGFTALATTHINNKELVLEYLKKINVSSRHLLSLINDVLDMSRIESGVVKLEEVQVHLPDVFHDLRSIIQGNICAKQQELYIDT